MSDSNSTTFKDIPGFPGYRAGDDGTIWSCWRNCRWGSFFSDKWHVIKPGVQKKRSFGRRYRYVNLHDENGTIACRVHRLILLTFVGPCPEGMQCRHLDGNPGNNRLDNLAWGTTEENIEDRKAHNRYTHRNYLITHNGETMSLKQWADRFGVPYQRFTYRIRVAKMSMEDAARIPPHQTGSRQRSNGRLGGPPRNL